MSVRRIGVLTSGGDAPGMNPCVRAVVRTALYHGLECYGIRRGWNGLISGDIVRLDEKSVAHTINRGGTILYTARSEEFMTEAGQRKAVSTCKFLGLDSIIAIGGDGTFRGALALSKYGINVIGIPGTIVKRNGKSTTQDLNQVDLPDPIAVEIECLRKRVMELEKILQTTHKIEAGCIDCAGSSNLEETLMDVIREKNRKEGNENEDL